MRLRILPLFFCLLAAVGAAQVSAPTTKSVADDFVGKWQGSLDLGATELRLGLEIRKDGEKLVARMVSIDQGMADMPVAKVTTEDATISLDVPAVNGSFKGTLNAQKSKIDGKWKQGIELDLVFARVEKIDTVERPQNPKAPFPYRSEDVVYSYTVGKKPAESFELKAAADDDKTKTTIGATLTLPEGDGPFPVAVLISGSGQQDRDETLMGHKPFLVLADHLTRAGIACLRYDDRGVGKSKGEFTNATSFDFADDAAAGVAYLKTRKDIDQKRIGLIGHSEGGLIGPLVAADDPSIAFVVMLAGPGVDGGEILMRQNRLISKAMGMSDAAIDAALALNEKLFEVIRREKDAKVVRESLRKLLEEAAEKEAKGDEEKKRAMVDGQMSAIATEWMRAFIAHDPRPTLAKLECAVLALNGERDMQVDPIQNLPAVAKALAEGKCRDWTVAAIPQLNHLFQTSKTGAPNEYPMISETFAPKALATITDWLKARYAK